MEFWNEHWKSAAIIIIYGALVVGMLGILYEYFLADRKYITAIDSALYLMKTDVGLFAKELHEIRDSHGFYTERLTSLTKEMATLSEVSRKNLEDIIMLKKKVFELRAVEE